MTSTIIINVDSTIAKSTLTKSGASQFTYKVRFTYYIDLCESNDSIEINSYYFMTMSLIEITPSIK